eukprot:gene1363-1796_t
MGCFKGFYGCQMRLPTHWPSRRRTFTPVGRPKERCYMPKVGMQPIRRQQLIEATLLAVDQVGMGDASIALIARLAGVSNGIISHYFQAVLVLKVMTDDAVRDTGHTVDQGNAG